MKPRFFDVITAVFVAVIILANVVAAPKVSNIGGIVFGSDAIFFPLSYIIGDIVTEVYGYSFARRLVWCGTGVMAFAALTTYLVILLPPDSSWKDQDAYVTVFGLSPRVAMASISAFWAGEFVNAFVLAKMKVKTRGRALWTRTVGSTVLGQAFDTSIFFPLAFAAIWPTHVLLQVMVANYFFKAALEVCCTPLTYRIVAVMKRVEQSDYYDIGTNFSPFARGHHELS